MKMEREKENLWYPLEIRWETYGRVRIATALNIMAKNSSVSGEPLKSFKRNDLTSLF